VIEVPRQGGPREHPAGQGTIVVAVGDMRVARSPDVLLTRALGSCVGLTMWDPSSKVAAMAHIMLPDSDEARMKACPSRFASTAVPMMVKRLGELGCPRRRLRVKLAGGAAMFKTESGMERIGARNIAEVRAQLERLGMAIESEDTGGMHARTIELRLDSGVLLVRSYVYGVHEI
jgi:chemotaxis protein CheD